MIFRQINWLGVLPQFILMVGAMSLFEFVLKIDNGLILGALLFLLITFALQSLVPMDHRNGLRAIKNYNFEQAIECFEKSRAFFEKNEWVDKYRAFTVFNASKSSYREMAFINIAYCYTELGDWAKAKAAYQTTLDNYPNNQMAQDAIGYIKDVENGVIDPEEA